MVGMPELNLPDLGLPPLVATIEDIASIECASAFGHATARCPAAGTMVLDTTTFTGVGRCGNWCEENWQSADECGCGVCGAILIDPTNASSGADCSVTCTSGPLTGVTFCPGHWMPGIVEQWSGGILTPDDGRIFGIPSKSSSIIIIDTEKGTTDVSTMSNLHGTAPSGSTTVQFAGGALAPNSKIYAIPHSSEVVLVIDPITKTADATSMSGLTGESKWSGGTLAPDGRIYGVPYDSEAVLIIDPLLSDLDFSEAMA